jgi:S-adenosylmethionine synthetase
LDFLGAEFDLTPAGIIRTLDLQRPISYPAAYGYLGREETGFPWEARVAEFAART